MGGAPLSGESIEPGSGEPRRPDPGDWDVPTSKLPTPTWSWRERLTWPGVVLLVSLGAASAIGQRFFERWRQGTAAVTATAVSPPLVAIPLPDPEPPPPPPVAVVEVVAPPVVEPPPPPPKPDRAAAEKAFREGARLLARGDPAAAVAPLAASAAADPGFAPAHRALGLGWQRLGDRERSLVALRRYLELWPDAADRGNIERLIAAQSRAVP